MAAYSTLNVSPHVAGLARALAKSRGIPVSALITELVEAAAGVVTETVYQAPRVETIGQMLRIRLGDMFIQIPSERAGAFAAHLRGAVEGKPPTFDLEMPEEVLVARRGAGIIVEVNNGKGQRVRSTTGVYEAGQIADAIDQHIGQL